MILCSVSDMIRNQLLLEMCALYHYNNQKIVVFFYIHFWKTGIVITLRQVVRLLRLTIIYDVSIEKHLPISLIA